MDNQIYNEKPQSKSFSDYQHSSSQNLRILPHNMIILHKQKFSTCPPCVCDQGDLSLTRVQSPVHPECQAPGICSDKCPHRMLSPLQIQGSLQLKKNNYFINHSCHLQTEIQDTERHKPASFGKGPNRFDDFQIPMWKEKSDNYRNTCFTLINIM